MQSLSPLSRCAQICGLTPKELIVGASPRPEHEFLAARYYRSSTIGKARMRRAMVAAIRAALKAAEPRSAADLLVALRMMLGRRRGRSWGARRRTRRSHQSRCAVEAPVGRPGDERGERGAIIVDFVERQAALASCRPLRLEA
ncbi:hypothetical protein [Methylocystis bryophila]|nr:hypothetical protein [Methylocystis bryophila]BDV39746.1 hypothetical protein DSM21852_29990 [Methylocystis bryophila]